MTPSERTRLWRETHPIEYHAMVARAEAKRRADPKRLAWKKAYGAANRARRKAIQKAWYDSHPQAHAAQCKASRAKKPEKYRLIALDAKHRYMARLRAQTVECVRLQDVYDDVKGICYLCGEFVAIDQCHFDHVVPVSLGGLHEASNLRPTHKRCNLRKGAKALENVVG